MFGGFSTKPVKSLVSKVLASPADELEIDPGAVELLKRPKAINPEDDMFNSPALDGKWIVGTAGYSFSSIPGWITLSGGWIFQACPSSGDWYIESEILMNGALNNTMALSLLSTSTVGAGTQADYFHYYDAVTTRNVQFQKLVNGVFNAQYTGSPTALQGFSMTQVFLRIKKVGTTYTTHWSDNGIVFYQQHSIAALGFTPAYFGLHGNGHANYFLRR